jgi:hypothetical protein
MGKTLRLDSFVTFLIVNGVVITIGLDPVPPGCFLTNSLPGVPPSGSLTNSGSGSNAPEANVQKSMDKYQLYQNHTRLHQKPMFKRQWTNLSPTITTPGSTRNQCSKANGHRSNLHCGADFCFYGADLGGNHPWNMEPILEPTTANCVRRNPPTDASTSSLHRPAAF